MDFFDTFIKIKWPLGLPWSSGPVANTPSSQSRGTGFDLWWETRSHWPTKSLHTATHAETKTKDLMCHNQDPAEAKFKKGLIDL